MWIKTFLSVIDAPGTLSKDQIPAQAIVGCLRIHSSVRAAGLMFWGRANYIQAQNGDLDVPWFPDQIKGGSRVKRQEVLGKQWRASWVWAVIHTYTNALPPAIKSQRWCHGGWYWLCERCQELHWKLPQPLSPRSMSAYATCPILIQTGLGVLIMLLTKAVSVLLFCLNLNLPGVWRHLWWGVDRSLCQFLASSVNCQQWDRNQCNTQCWWCFLRNGRLNIRIPQKYCNEDRQWCSRRERHAGHTCQPVRLPGTCPAQSPSDHNQKKDAAYLSFSSSFGRRAKNKAASKASMQVHQDIKSR